MTNLEQIAEQLTPMVRAKTGDSGARVARVETLPGHAAFGCSFVVERSDAGATPSGKMVLRLAPEGVRIAGPADVVLQAKRMESIADTEVPVPPILWYGEEPEFFGRPYFVAGFVDSFKLGERTDFSSDEIKSFARMGVRTLAALHRVDWRRRRSAWGDPQPVLDEMRRLYHLLDRPTVDPREVARAPILFERLRASMPETMTGCVHGDFHFGNLLYNDMGVAAVIDWEMALLGPALLDLGWMCFFADPGSGVDLGRMRGITPLDREEIVAIYSESGKFAVSKHEVNWFSALAGYRIGALACFNVMLHRRGKRHDPEWEVLARTAPAMFEHGLELLG